MQHIPSKHTSVSVWDFANGFFENRDDPTFPNAVEANPRIYKIITPILSCAAFAFSRRLHDILSNCYYTILSAFNMSLNISTKARNTNAATEPSATTAKTSRLMPMRV
jgi:hypothetical protein